MNEQMLELLKQQLAVERESRNWLRFFGILTIISLAGGAIVGLYILLSWL